MSRKSVSSPASNTSASFSCPHCDQPIELTEAMAAQMEHRIRKELDAQAADGQRALTQRAEALKAQERAMEAAQAGMDAEVAKRLAAERLVMEERARTLVKEQLRSEYGVEIADAKTQAAEMAQRLKLSQEAELSLRQKSRALEEQSREMELLKQREMDALRQEIVDKTRSQAAQEHRLLMADKDKRIESMVKQIEDLHQKGLQGSQQAQGDVQEVDLEAILRAAFPHDTFEPVPTGIRGADIVQMVHNAQQEVVGSIVWESKRTKSFGGDWLAKLKSDQREIKADLAVIVSQAMPKGVETFTEMEGVWVSTLACSVAVGSALRFLLLNVAQVRQASAGHKEKAVMVYEYLTGPLFRQRVQTTIEAWAEMQEDLDREKRVITKAWAKRSKQLEIALSGSAGLYGDLQGIAGKSVLEIEAFDMGALDSGDEPPALELES